MAGFFFFFFSILVFACLIWASRFFPFFLFFFGASFYFFPPITKPTPSTCTFFLFPDGITTIIGVLFVYLFFSLFLVFSLEILERLERVSDDDDDDTYDCIAALHFAFFDRWGSVTIHPPSRYLFFMTLTTFVCLSAYLRMGKYDFLWFCF